jgi:Mn2+/Fe2+ NRAMP family transporter
LLAAVILPVTAAYVFAETFGFAKGIWNRPREASVFVGVITTLIAIGTIVALIPGLPVIKLLVDVQVVNGVLLPVTLVFIWRLAADRELMGRYANGRTFNVLAGATVLATSTLSLLLFGVTLAGFVGLVVREYDRDVDDGSRRAPAAPACTGRSTCDVFHGNETVHARFERERISAR